MTILKLFMTSCATLCAKLGRAIFGVLFALTSLSDRMLSISMLVCLGSGADFLGAVDASAYIESSSINGAAYLDKLHQLDVYTI